MWRRALAYRGDAGTLRLREEKESRQAEPRTAWEMGTKRHGGWGGGRKLMAGVCGREWWWRR